MNKKVIKTMIALTMIFLVALYVLKIFFPEQFMMVIQNERIVAFGEFVDNNLLVHILLGTTTSTLTYFLYVCACAGRIRVKWYTLLTILGISFGSQIIYYFVDVNIGTSIGTLAMFCLPIFEYATLKQTAFVFSFHYIAQLLSTKIRSLPMYLTSVNYATIFLMMCEGYFWLLLFYFYFNYKKERK